LFTSEEQKNAGDVAATLRQIAEKIDTGTLNLKSGAEEIQIDFPETMVFELKVEEEQGKRLKKSLEIQLEWIVGEGSTQGAQIL
jgi:amphi-Trp domain-containing protein